MKIADYISANFASIAEFARSNEVNPQQVTKWINAEWIVVDGTIYSPKRKVARNDHTKE